MSGVTYALFSAVAAAVTAILAKIGVEGVSIPDDVRREWWREWGKSDAQDAADRTR